MKLYRLKTSENYTSYSIKGYSKARECDKVEKLMSAWEEKKLSVINRKKEGELAFCWLPMNHLLLSEEAIEKLNPYINSEEIELLPVKKGKKTYYIAHGVKADKLTCDIVKKGIVMRYVFVEEELRLCEIEERLVIKAEMNYGVLSDLFFTERFVELIKENNLQGVEFEVEWDSEAEN